MSKTSIDARGLSCPEPVILTQRAIDSGLTEFSVLVNSAVARENVMRCIGKNGLKCGITEEKDAFIIDVTG